MISPSAAAARPLTPTPKEKGMGQQKRNHPNQQTNNDQPKRRRSQPADADP